MGPGGSFPVQHRLGVCPTARGLERDVRPGWDGSASGLETCQQVAPRNQLSRAPQLLPFPWDLPAGGGRGESCGKWIPTSSMKIPRL